MNSLKDQNYLHCIAFFCICTISNFYLGSDHKNWLQDWLGLWTDTKVTQQHLSSKLNWRWQLRELPPPISLSVRGKHSSLINRYKWILSDTFKQQGKHYKYILWKATAEKVICLCGRSWQFCLVYSEITPSCRKISWLSELGRRWDQSGLSLWLLASTTFWSVSGSFTVPAPSGFSGLEKMVMVY